MCREEVKNEITVLFSVDYVVRNTGLFIQFLDIYALPVAHP
jgi:hypothetical protein